MLFDIVKLFELDIAAKIEAVKRASNCPSNRRRTTSNRCRSRRDHRGFACVRHDPATMAAGIGFIALYRWTAKIATRPRPRYIPDRGNRGSRSGGRWPGKINKTFKLGTNLPQ
jgi:hypothetical protein